MHVQRLVAVIFGEIIGFRAEVVGAIRWGGEKLFRVHLRWSGFGRRKLGNLDVENDMIRS